MKIEFSKNELKHLLELLYFGEFMFSSSSSAHPEKNEKYDKLIQKIYNIANENGLSHLFKLFKGKISPTREFEEDEFITGVIDVFEDEFFWDELMYLLSERDILEKMTMDEYRNLDIPERIELQTKHEEPYYEEFTKNGLRNLKILSSDLSFLRKK